MPSVIAVSDAPAAGSHGEIYVAPGRDVPTTEPGDRWTLVNGSSFAAAHVSGLLALMRERSGKASQRLLVTSRNGGGLIDACRTLARTAGQADRVCQDER